MPHPPGTQRPRIMAARLDRADVVLLALIGVVVVIASLAIPASIAAAEQQARVSAVILDAERVDRAARGAAYLEAARTGAREFAEPYRGVGEALAGVLTTGDLDELDESLAQLDAATASTDLGAVAAARNRVESALVLLADSVATRTAEVLGLHPLTDETSKTAVATALASLHEAVASNEGQPAAFTAVGVAVNAAIASHTAADAARLAAENARLTAEASTSGDPGDAGVEPEEPGIWPSPPPAPAYEPLVVIAQGEYTPGCFGTIAGSEYYRNGGTVVLNPGFAYDYIAEEHFVVTTRCDPPS